MSIVTTTNNVDCIFHTVTVYFQWRYFTLKRQNTSHGMHQQKNFNVVDKVKQLPNRIPDVQFTPNEYDEALICIEDVCLAITNKAMTQLGMTAPKHSVNNFFVRNSR